MTTTQQLPRSEVKFAPRRVGHGNFFVSDLERSMTYYEHVLGLQEVFREPAIVAGFLSNGNSHHDVGLIEIPKETLIGRDGQVQVMAKADRRPGLNHIGWEMETEAHLVEAYKRAVEAGVEVHRTVDHLISHSVYLWDPEGNYHEFYADAEEDWRAVYERNTGALITGNWDPTASAPSERPKYNPDPTYQNVPGAPLRPIRAARVSMLVADLEAMTRFYTDVIGLQVAADQSGDGFVILSGALGYWDVGLFAAGAQTRGMHHFGFELADAAELETATERLRSAGADVVGEFSHPTKRSVAVRDPDGILLEFYVEESREAAQLDAPLEPAPFTI
jgi:catechol 2,3-dioxygenase